MSVPSITKPEIQRVLVLSTGHVPEYVANLLDAPDNESPVCRMKWDEGWLVWCISADEEGVPPELVHILKYARKLGCDQVRFDCDALRLEGLPWFDW